jgi:hypothetical protein
MIEEDSLEWFSNLLEDFRSALGTSPSFMKAAAADSAAKKCGGNVVSN